MKIRILGTGTFYVNQKRSGPSYLLEADGKKILIDCGPGTLNRLSQIKVDPRDIDFVFISHFHADHTTDLFAFQMNYRLNDSFNSRKLDRFPIIYGPKGIKDFTKKLSDIYQLPGLKDWGKIQYKEFKNTITIGDLVVKPFKVDHIAFGLKAEAYAIRFELNEKIFVFSGDCVKCPGIEKAAEDADLFICDASYKKENGSPAHMDTYDIGEISKAGKVKKVVLTHFYPNTEDIDLAGEVKEKFFGEVVRGEDLMEFVL